MTVTLRHDPELHALLTDWRDPADPDGPSLGEVLFPDGRLTYPGRADVEAALGHPEPYTLGLEARTFRGLPPRLSAAVRVLCGEVMHRGWGHGHDPLLDLLWGAHQCHLDASGAVSPDRLVVSLVAVRMLADGTWLSRPDLDDAAVALVAEMHGLGMPPTRDLLCRLIEPACVMLGFVEPEVLGSSSSGTKSFR